MAKRQFTASDTSTWATKYGDGSSGVKTYSANHTMDSSDGAYYSRVTSGNPGDLTANTPDLANGTYNLPCKIVNEFSTANPNWEYNFLISVSGGVATFKYPLTISCSSVLGSQVITGNPYASVVINSGVTITPPSWNGSYGGRIVWFARDSWINHGTVDFTGRGFRNGQAVGNNSQGFCGEGTGGGSSQGVLGPNGNGGGGGGWSDNNPWNQGNGGAGGSNVTQGQNGSGSGGGNNAHGGPGTTGNTASSSDGVTHNMGGGGGSGGNNDGSGGSGAGGSGAGCLDVVSRSITSDGSILFNGNNGSSSNYHAGGGGSGAGGFGIFKGQRINLGGAIQCLGGAHVNAGGHPGSSGDEDGGYGGNGGIAAYYSQTQTVSSNPAATLILDTTLNDTAGAFGFLIN